MKLPAIWRKKRKDRKEYGNCYATVGGRDINLESEDRNEARKKLREILLGQAADASEPDIEDGGGGEAAPVGTTPAPVPLPTSPVPGSVIPDQIIPPPAPASSESEARAEADATNAAAAEAGSAAGATNDNAGAAAAFSLPPEAIEGMLAQGAQAIVLMQLELQAWIVKKRMGGKAPKPLNLESPMAQMLIDAAAKGWVAQLKAWFPDIELCPPWVIAVGAPLLFLPAQISTAQDATPEKPPENQASGPATAVA